jgi:hypothetical protein
MARGRLWQASADGTLALNSAITMPSTGAADNAGFEIRDSWRPPRYGCRYAITPPRRKASQKGTRDMNQQQRFLRAWPALVVGLLVLLLPLFFSDDQSPLSPLETRLVGEWSANPSGSTRCFWPNRTFSTSNGLVVGVWRIRDGRLTLTYWQTYQLPPEYSFAAVAHSIRRIRKDTVSWDITFAEDGQGHILSIPVSEDCPAGQWLWRRVADE